jgi:poly(hydroxyalkanoate) granule-associated protein
MAEQADKVVDNEQENGANLFTRVGDVAVKTFMVGLGTVGFAQDELKKFWEEGGSFVDKLEERGETMSQGGLDQLNKQRDKVNSQFETRQGQVKDLGTKANESIEQASGAVLTRANVPTSEDVQNLSEQISALNRKVDKLRKEQQELAAEEPVTEELATEELDPDED